MHLKQKQHNPRIKNTTTWLGAWADYESIMSWYHGIDVYIKFQKVQETRVHLG